MDEDTELQQGVDEQPLEPVAADSAPVEGDDDEEEEVYVVRKRHIRDDLQALAADNEWKQHYNDFATRDTIGRIRAEEAERQRILAEELQRERDQRLQLEEQHEKTRAEFDQAQRGSFIAYNGRLTPEQRGQHMANPKFAQDYAKYVTNPEAIPTVMAPEARRARAEAQNLLTEAATYGLHPQRLQQLRQAWESGTFKQLGGGNEFGAYQALRQQLVDDIQVQQAWYAQQQPTAAPQQQAQIPAPQPQAAPPVTPPQSNQRLAGQQPVVSNRGPSGGRGKVRLSELNGNRALIMKYGGGDPRAIDAAIAAGEIIDDTRQTA